MFFAVLSQRKIGCMQTSDPPAEPPRQNNVFGTTRWSVVLAAKQRSSPDSSAALEELCRTYWYPLYVYVRRRGYSRDDAADLNQAFFAHLLEKNGFASVERSKGKFRAFLIASMKHFLANEWDKLQAEKRGGGNMPVSIDRCAAEASYQLEPTDTFTAERAFQRRWALTLLDCIFGKLKAEYVANGKSELFDRIKGTITSGYDAGSYREIAEDLGMSEGAVKVAAHRLRQRYRELLVHEVSQTVSQAEQVEDEVAELFSALSNHGNR